jgi:Rrf2 family protein
MNLRPLFGEVMYPNNFTTLGILLLRELCRAKKPLTQAELAKLVGITPNYVQQVAIRLVRARLISGVRGPNGGYVLARPRHKVNVAEVVAAMMMRKKRPGGSRFLTTAETVHRHIMAALATLPIDGL